MYISFPKEIKKRGGPKAAPFLRLFSFLGSFLYLCTEIESDHNREHGHKLICQDVARYTQIAEYRRQQDRDDALYGQQLCESFLHYYSPLFVRFNNCYVGLYFAYVTLDHVERISIMRYGFNSFVIDLTAVC